MEISHTKSENIWGRLTIGLGHKQVSNMPTDVILVTYSVSAKDLL